MTTRATIVLDFGAIVTGSTETQFILDWEGNLDADGNEKTSFLPTDTVYMLAQFLPDVSFLDLKASTPGCSLKKHGDVTRTVTEDVEFSSLSPDHAIQYQITGSATAEFDGNAPALSINAETGVITASNNLPAIGQLSYDSIFTSLSLGPASSIDSDLQKRQDDLGDNEQAQYRVLVVCKDDAGE